MYFNSNTQQNIDRFYRSHRMMNVLAIRIDRFTTIGIDLEFIESNAEKKRTAPAITVNKTIWSAVRVKVYRTTSYRGNQTNLNRIRLKVIQTAENHIWHQEIKQTIIKLGLIGCAFTSKLWPFGINCIRFFHCIII